MDDMISLYEKVLAELDSAISILNESATDMRITDEAVELWA
jgi:hypothetical protein